MSPVSDVLFGTLGEIRTPTFIVRSNASFRLDYEGMYGTKDSNLHLPNSDSGALPVKLAPHMGASGCLSRVRRYAK